VIHNILIEALKNYFSGNNSKNKEY